MDVFFALADPTRRSIVELLAMRGQLSASDISNKFPTSASAISQHLKILRQSGLVDMEKRAQQRLYQINPDAVTELDPENAEAWHQRGIVHLMQNNTEQALADLKRALEIDPRHYKALRDLGALLQQTGDQRGALDAYRKALAVNPFLEQAKRAEEQLSHEVEGRDI